MRRQSVAMFLVLCSSLVLGFGTASAQPHGPDTLWTQMYAPARYSVAFTGWATPRGFTIAGAAGDTIREMEGLPDYFLTHLDQQGNVMWSRRYGQIDGVQTSNFAAACATPGGGAMLVGGSNSGLLIMRTDDVGDTIWTRTYLPPILPLIVKINRIVPAVGGGFIICGQAWGQDMDDFYDGFLWKVSETGEALWTQYYPVGYATRESVDAILPLPDGYLLALSSVTYAPQGGRDSTYIYAVWTDTAGEVLRAWQFAFRRTNEVYSVCSDSGGGYYFAGSAVQDSVPRARLLFCVDSVGTLLWGGLNGVDANDWCSYFATVVGTVNGCVALGSRTYVDNQGRDRDDAVLARFNQVGDTLWASAYLPPFHSGHLYTFFVNHLIKTRDGGYLVVGNNSVPFPEQDNPALICTESDPLTATDPLRPTVREFRLWQNYPNPFNASTAIVFEVYRTQRLSLDVFDTGGRHVATLLKQPVTVGRHDVTFDALRLPSGPYYVQLSGESSTQTIRLTLLR